MNYATEQTLIDLYGQRQYLLAADRNKDGTADPATVANALANATSEINSYLKRQYASVLPLNPVPDVIAEACAAIAMYKMASAAGAGRVTDELRQRYEDAIAFLNRLAKGVAQLDIDAPDDGSAGDEVKGGEILTDGPERLFGRGRMGGLP